jgi:hypothetical protein
MLGFLQDALHLNKGREKCWWGRQLKRKNWNLMGAVREKEHCLAEWLRCLWAKLC